jgi:polyphosphate glucokinase
VRVSRGHRARPSTTTEPVISDRPRPKRRQRILVVDVGGTHVKLLSTGQSTPIRVPSGPGLTPIDMVGAVREAVRGWRYDVVSIGYPGPVADGRIIVEPRNLGTGWTAFDFEAAFERPVRILNDAAMQALGGYKGGRMLFLGLGTGLGSALVIEGHLQPLELAHLPYQNGREFEEYVGEAGRRRLGNRKWRRHVYDVCQRLVAAMQSQSLLIGGGSARRLAKHLDKLPPDTRLGSNADAFRGGFRLWMAPEDRLLVQADPVSDAALPTDAPIPDPAPPTVSGAAPAD